MNETLTSQDKDSILQQTDRLREKQAGLVRILLPGEEDNVNDTDLAFSTMRKKAIGDVLENGYEAGHTSFLICRDILYEEE